jgi:hypothetical protein
MCFYIHHCVHTLRTPQPGPAFLSEVSTFADNIIRPESIRSNYEVDNAPPISAEEAVKAVVAFFESAITPEKEDENGENEKEHDESAGVVELYFAETSDCRFGVSLGP